MNISGIDGKGHVFHGGVDRLFFRFDLKPPPNLHIISEIRTFRIISDWVDVQGVFFPSDAAIMVFFTTGRLT